jgi:hypothetical protein
MAMGGQQPTAHALDTTRAVIVSGQAVAGVGGMTALHSPPAPPWLPLPQASGIPAWRPAEAKLLRGKQAIDKSGEGAEV